MSKPSLSDRLTTGAPAQELTTREARRMGWTIKRVARRPGDIGNGRAWCATTTTGPARGRELWAETCSGMLDLIRRAEESAVRS